MSRLKKMLAAVLTASVLMVMMVMMASPAFAFIHEFIPAGECAASDQAGENATAAAHLPRLPIETPPAPDECPAP